MARLGIGTGRGIEDPEGAAALHDLASGRLRLVAGHEVDPADRRPGLERRLAALLGARIPLLGKFVVEAADGGELVEFRPGLAMPDEVDDWLDAVGRVRTDVGRLTTAGLLSELVDDHGGLRAVAGQSPIVAGESWAATGPVNGSADDRGARLSVVAVTASGAAPSPGEARCGLVVDQWSERIPGRKQTTGLTFQYDAPTNQAPQAWLLTVPAPGEQWSYELVVNSLLGTLDRARMRTVGRFDRSYSGVTRPTLYVPGSLDGWPLDDGAIG